MDIFAKDWLFVPIHDHLHWSLVLVAHPGVLPSEDADRAQCIIHFDSMDGGEHNTHQRIPTIFQGQNCNGSGAWNSLMPASKSTPTPHSLRI